MNYSKRGTKMTNEEFDLKIKDSNFKRISDYKNTSISLKFECKRCGKNFMKKPKEFKRLLCKCQLRESNYLRSIEDKEISLLEPYTNMRDKLLHMCNICNNEFRTPPRTVQSSKNGCPVCSGKKFNIDKYKTLLPKDIIITGEYINALINTKHKCLRCEHIWNPKPNYIIHMNTGCPNCNRSKGERMVSNILDEMKIEYNQEYQIKINEQNLRFDFYLKEFNLLIEYDGIQHTKPIKLFGGKEEFIRIQERDKIKNKWSDKNNIKLLRIPHTSKKKEDIKKFILEEMNIPN